MTCAFECCRGRFAAGTPKSTGVYYDDSYDRTLYPPGQGCTGKPGTEAIFDESLDFDSWQ
jgi:hypothetical protein